MTIKLAPETEEKLRQKAEREGQDIDSIANALLSQALDWEAQDRVEAILGIQRGLEASDAGRVRPAGEVFRDMRAKIKAAKK
ncbi:MAG TPA: hypothetical protein VFW40_13930 [Capsulimonadaceae bacterium]|nr:hypothetical protein [Capsulimonadaceae bacterium]